MPPEPMAPREVERPALTDAEVDVAPSSSPASAKGSRFWMIIVGLVLSVFVAVLEGVRTYCDFSEVASNFLSLVRCLYRAPRHCQ